MPSDMDTVQRRLRVRLRQPISPAPRRDAVGDISDDRLHRIDALSSTAAASTAFGPRARSPGPEPDRANYDAGVSAPPPDPDPAAGPDSPGPGGPGPGGPGHDSERLVGELVAVAASIDGRSRGAEPVVLSARRGVLMLRLGGLVLKAHAPRTDAAALAARLRIAADPGLGGVLLPPIPIPGATLGTAAVRAGGRLVSAWPACAPLRPDELDAVPWGQAATLLARLHTAHADAPGGAATPPAGSAHRVRRTMARLNEAAEAGLVPADPGTVEAVRRAYATLPDWLRGCGPAPGRGRPTLVHGDWHLGQLVRFSGGWRLIDVDDLGVGDPAWDLARPAAWYAAGVLTPQVWHRFLGAYLDAGGPAVPADADPWPALDVPAKAMAVQTAAQSLVRAADEGIPVDEVARAFIDCCGRIAGLDAGAPGPVSSSLLALRRAR